MSRAVFIALALLLLPFASLRAAEGSGAAPAPPDHCSELRKEAEGWSERVP